jgi:hypothetical protein
MALQAFFDDSGNEPTSPIFVLAGFITTNQRWAAFSDEWQLALEEPPRLEYFKMAEAEHFRGQFSKRKGWTNENRDARLITLANIVAKYAIVRVHVSILHSSFQQWIKSIRNPTRNSAQDNPYFALFQLIVQIVSAFRVRAFNNDPCEIVLMSRAVWGLTPYIFGRDLGETRPLQRRKPQIFSMVISIIPPFSVMRRNAYRCKPQTFMHGSYAADLLRRMVCCDHHFWR